MNEIEAVLNGGDMTFEEAVEYFRQRVPVSRAPGEGVPGAGKERAREKGVKRPLTPLQRRGGHFTGDPRKTASNAVRTALTAVLGLCPGKETRKRWRSLP